MGISDYNTFYWIVRIINLTPIFPHGVIVLSLLYEAYIIPKLKKFKHEILISFMNKHVKNF